MARSNDFQYVLVLFSFSCSSNSLSLRSVLLHLILFSSFILERVNLSLKNLSVSALVSRNLISPIPIGNKKGTQRRLREVAKLCGNVPNKDTLVKFNIDTPLKTKDFTIGLFLEANAK